jgi:hypothetical protein
MMTTAEQPEPMPEWKPRPQADVNLPNLAQNALPITSILAAMVLYRGNLDLTRMRLRDSWLTEGPSGPLANFAVVVGGDLRGGENGALWGRARTHRDYIDDADLKLPERDMERLLKNWARITFMVPAPAWRPIEAILKFAPHVKQSPVDKLGAAMTLNKMFADDKDAVEFRTDQEAVTLDQALPNPRAIERMVADLALRVESIRLCPP